MTDENEPEEIEFVPEDLGDVYPDTLSSPDGQIHFGVDGQVFLAHWLEKLGFGVKGAAVIFGEGCSIGILHPETGEVLTPADIAKRVHKLAPVK
jgi:hypothetical protein